MITVKFECDIIGNHTCDIAELSRVKVLTFEDSIDALHFIEAPELFMHIDVNDLDTDVIPLDELNNNLNISSIFKQIINY